MSGVVFSSNTAGESTGRKIQYTSLLKNISRYFSACSIYRILFASVRESFVPFKLELSDIIHQLITEIHYRRIKRHQVSHPSRTHRSGIGALEFLGLAIFGSEQLQFGADGRAFCRPTPHAEDEVVAYGCFPSNSSLERGEAASFYNTSPVAVFTIGYTSDNSMTSY